MGVSDGERWSLPSLGTPRPTAWYPLGQPVRNIYSLSLAEDPLPVGHPVSGLSKAIELLWPITLFREAESEAQSHQRVTL